MNRFYELKNIAVNKPTEQLTTAKASWTGGKALSSSYANDGDKRCKDSIGTRIHASTSSVVNPFWKVDLKHTAVVLNVTVQNTNDVYGIRINPFDIRVGNMDTNGGISNPLCVAGATLPDEGGMKNFTCPETEGRYVSIHLSRKENLMLCEVEVYGIYPR